MSEALDRVCVVLVEPSHPGNVGSVARAMRVMGLRDLRLVSPRFEGLHLHRDARALAAGADALLESAQTFERLPAALADRHLCIAVSAGAREFGPTPQTPEAVCDELIDEGGLTALVFGAERTGLSVADVGLCQRLCTIPTDDEHSSLNLAQAVQVLAYVLRRQCLARERNGAASGQPDRPADAIQPKPDGARPDRDATPCDAGLPPRAQPLAIATQHEVEGLFEHLERSLVAIRFLDPAHPKKLMPRLRRLFGRTRLETEEVHLLRGVCKLILETASRNSEANLQSRPGPENPQPRRADPAS